MRSVVSGHRIDLLQPSLRKLAFSRQKTRPLGFACHFPVRRAHARDLRSLTSPVRTSWPRLTAPLSGSTSARRTPASASGSTTGTYPARSRLSRGSRRSEKRRHSAATRSRRERASIDAPEAPRASHPPETVSRNVCRSVSALGAGNSTSSPPPRRLGRRDDRGRSRKKVGPASTRAVEQSRRLRKFDGGRGVWRSCESRISLHKTRTRHFFFCDGQGRGLFSFAFFERAVAKTTDEPFPLRNMRVSSLLANS